MYIHVFLRHYTSCFHDPIIMNLYQITCVIPANSDLIQFSKSHVTFINILTFRFRNISIASIAGGSKTNSVFFSLFLLLFNLSQRVSANFNSIFQILKIAKFSSWINIQYSTYDTVKFATGQSFIMDFSLGLQVFLYALSYM